MIILRQKEFGHSKGIQEIIDVDVSPAGDALGVSKDTQKRIARFDISKNIKNKYSRVYNNVEARLKKSGKPLVVGGILGSAAIGTGLAMKKKKKDKEEDK